MEGHPPPGVCGSASVAQRPRGTNGHTQNSAQLCACAWLEGGRGVGVYGFVEWGRRRGWVILEEEEEEEGKERKTHTPRVKKKQMLLHNEKEETSAAAAAYVS